MSLLQLLGLGRHRTEEALLVEELTALQTALARCKGVASRWRRQRGAVIILVAIVTMVLGFAAGAYRETLQQMTADLLSPIGLISTSNADGGFAAFQNGKYETALRSLRPLAEQGNERAQSAVGLMYYKGNGVAQDDQQALHWFRLAAGQGNSEAQFNLGVMYSEAQGVPQDHAEAAKWYRLAADQGNPKAQYNLGLWYANGDGGSPDYVNAHMWFNLAASHFPASDTRNRGEAIRNRDATAAKMTSEQIAQAQQLAREWKPK
jgi:uncharacterized protein